MMRGMQPEPPVLDRRSLAYRLNLVLNTTQVMCMRGSDNSAQTHRRGQALIAIMSAAELGSTMTVDELVALREGEQHDVDPRELALIAQAMDVPGWVLTQTPPEGKRLVLATTRAGANLAVLVSDDGDPSGVLTPAAKQELATRLRELSPEEQSGQPTVPALLTRHEPTPLPPAVQYLLNLPPSEQPVMTPRRRWGWRMLWPGRR